MSRITRRSRRLAKGANPSVASVHVNQVLTNVAVANYQDPANFKAHQIFPRCPVTKQTDIYRVFPAGEIHRDEMKERAPGTEAAEAMGWTLDNSNTYRCKQRALRIPITDEQRINADPGVNIDERTAIELVLKAAINAEVRFNSTYMPTAGGVWSTEYTGVTGTPTTGQVRKWSDDASTPIEDIIAAKATVHTKTYGFTPNVLAVGLNVHNALLRHPDMIDLIKYGQTPGAPAMANEEVIAKILGVERYIVMTAVYNSANAGATAVPTLITGDTALLAYATPTPAIDKPTAGYHFHWTQIDGSSDGGGVVIKQFREDLKGRDLLQIELADDPKVVAVDAAAQFLSIV